MKYQKLTHGIIGCAMKVHAELGNGFQEVIYQRALAIEMRNYGLSFAREMSMHIFYKERKIGTRRVDFFGAKSMEFKRVYNINHPENKRNTNKT